MIISASRRTDIPAFYAPWFMGRIREQYCTVLNPFNRQQVNRVSLRPEDVDGIVFWTRNPEPLLPYLAELDRRGYRYYFLVTLTGYGPPLELDNPPLDRAVKAITRLAGRIGSERVVWRYDPLILSRITDGDFHRRNFARLSSMLAGSCRRVIVSLLEGYPKTRRELKKLSIDVDMAFPEMAPETLSGRGLLADIAAMAGSYGLEIQSCASRVELTPLGIPPGKCIDDELIDRIFGLEVSHTKDRSQRPDCRCIPSRDIGAYNTCLHGCRYCYATHSLETARQNYRAHDPVSPSLGRPAGQNFLKGEVN